MRQLTRANPEAPRGGLQEVQVTKLRKMASATLIMVAVLTVLSACQKQEGPAEHAGKEIDRAADKVGQQVEKAGENLQDASKGDKK